MYVISSGAFSSFFYLHGFHHLFCTVVSFLLITFHNVKIVLFNFSQGQKGSRRVPSGPRGRGPMSVRTTDRTVTGSDVQITFEVMVSRLRPQTV